MSFTPPVSRGNFHFANGDFYVSANPQNRHRRATVSELQALFHPPTPEKAAADDPPGHWYNAQLLHYGLNPSNTKGTAVKRLLDAVNTGTLDIPAHLRKLELGLKKIWDSKERRMKMEISAALRGARGETAKGRERRTNDRGAGGSKGCITPVAVAGFEVVDMKLDLGTNTNRVGAGEAADAPGQKRKTKKDDKPTPSRKRSCMEATEAQRAQKSTSEANEEERREESRFTKIEVVITAGKNNRSHIKPRREPELEVLPPIRSVSPVETEFLGDRPYTPTRPPCTRSRSSINGKYEVSFSNNNHGEMFLCIDGQSIRADFRVPGAPTRGEFDLSESLCRASLAMDKPYRFTWRGTDDHGRVKRGWDCTGKITILGGGRIAGSFRGLYQRRERCEFHGERVSDVEAQPARLAASMDDEDEDDPSYYGSP